MLGRGSNTEHPGGAAVLGTPCLCSAIRAADKAPTDSKIPAPSSKQLNPVYFQILSSLSCSNRLVGERGLISDALGFNNHTDKQRKKDEYFLTDLAAQIFVFSEKQTKQNEAKKHKQSLAKVLVFGSATGVCWTPDKMCHFNLDKYKCEQGVSC